MLWFFCQQSFDPLKFLENAVETLLDIQFFSQSLDERKGPEAWWRAREITLQLVASKLGNRAGGLQDPHLWRYNLKDEWSLVAFYLPYEGMTPEDQQRVVIDLVKAADCFMHPMFSPIRFTPTTVPLTTTKIGTEVRESLNLPESPIVRDNTFLIWYSPLELEVSEKAVSCMPGRIGLTKMRCYSKALNVAGCRKLFTKIPLKLEVSPLVFFGALFHKAIVSITGHAHPIWHPCPVLKGPSESTKLFAYAPFFEPKDGYGEFGLDFQQVVSHFNSQHRHYRRVLTESLDTPTTPSEDDPFIFCSDYVAHNGSVLLIVNDHISCPQAYFEDDAASILARGEHPFALTLIITRHSKDNYITISCLNSKYTCSPVQINDLCENLSVLAQRIINDSTLCLQATALPCLPSSIYFYAAMKWNSDASRVNHQGPFWHNRPLIPTEEFMWKDWQNNPRSLQKKGGQLCVWPSVKHFRTKVLHQWRNTVDYVGAVPAKYISDEPVNSVSYFDNTRAKWIVPQIPGFCDADEKTRDSWLLQVYNMRSINTLAGSRPCFKSDRASEFINELLLQPMKLLSPAAEYRWAVKLGENKYGTVGNGHHVWLDGIGGAIEFDILFSSWFFPYWSIAKYTSLYQLGRFPQFSQFHDAVKPFYTPSRISARHQYWEDTIKRYSLIVKSSVIWPWSSNSEIPWKKGIRSAVFEVPSSVLMKLHTLRQQENATPFHLLASLLVSFLYTLSNPETQGLCISYPASLRPTQNQYWSGTHANMLPLFVQFEKTVTPRNILQAIKTQRNSDRDNQHTLWPEIAKLMTDNGLVVPNIMLADTLLNLYNLHPAISSQIQQTIYQSHKDVLYDLTLLYEWAPDKSKLALRWEFRRALFFFSTTPALFEDLFKKFLEDVADQPDNPGVLTHMLFIPPGASVAPTLSFPEEFTAMPQWNWYGKLHLRQSGVNSAPIEFTIPLDSENSVLQDWQLKLCQTWEDILLWASVVYWSKVSDMNEADSVIFGALGSRNEVHFIDVSVRKVASALTLQESLECFLASKKDACCMVGQAAFCTVYGTTSHANTNFKSLWEMWAAKPALFLGLEEGAIRILCDPSYNLAPSRYEHAAQSILHILLSAAKCPGTPLKALNLIDNSPSEKELIGKAFVQSHPSDSPLVTPWTTLVDAFIFQVKRNPSIKIWIGNKAAGPVESHTITELFQLATALAISKPIVQRCTHNDVVFLSFPRGWEAIIALWGVLLAGGACCPLDPEIPEARAHQLIDKVKCMCKSGLEPLVLTTSKLADHGLREKIVLKGELIVVQPSTAQLPPQELVPVSTQVHQPTPDDLAFVLFTSGTSGQPKAIPTRHRAWISRMIKSAPFVFMLDKEDPTSLISTRPRSSSCGCMAHVCSPYFDVALFEQTFPLVFGMDMGIVGEWVPDLHLLANLAQQSHLTHMTAVPSFLKALTSREELCAIVAKSMKCVASGGEALSVEFADKLASSFPNASIVNAYGPAEAAYVYSCFEYHPENNSAMSDVEKATRTVPIGKPLPGDGAIILDGDTHQPVPFGVPGELCILSPCLTKGYLNDSAETAKHFIQAPPEVCAIVSHGDLPSLLREDSVLYLTGDYVRWNDNFELEYIRRTCQNKNQVKVHGMRVETEEIAFYIRSYHSSITDVVVCLGNGNLIAYIENASIHNSDEENSLRRGLHGRLKQQLPRYMVPYFYVILPTFPHTTSGKLDHKAFPPPLPTRDLPLDSDPQSVGGDSFLSSEAKMLQDEVEQVLGFSILPTQDLRGLINSLAFYRLQQRIQKKTSVNISARDFSDYCTIERLGQHLQKVMTPAAAHSPSGTPTAATTSPVVSRLSRNRLSFSSESHHPTYANRPRSRCSSSPRSRDTPTTDSKFPIAIIGLAVKYPGANCLEELWEIVVNKRDTITRWEPSIHNRVGARGIIADFDSFDYNFFSVTYPKLYDPQAMLLNEISWCALEDSGYCPSLLRQKGTRVGYYTACPVSSYATTHLLPLIPVQDMPNLTQRPLFILQYNEAFMSTVAAASTMKFKGPIIACDAACGASAACVHLASQSLRVGECDMAMVSSSVMLFPRARYGYERVPGLMSTDGKVAPFDESASGFVQSEGAGSILFKPLDKALYDHDHIYAVLSGIGQCSDPSICDNVMALHVDILKDSIDRCHQSAGVKSKDEIGYVECHGAATAVGDFTEMASLCRALSEPGKSQFCAIGSIKANIGHSFQAAGIAAIAKVICILNNNYIPGLVNFNQVHGSVAPLFADPACPLFIPKDGFVPSSPIQRAAVICSAPSGSYHMLFEKPPELPPTELMNERKDFLMLFSALTETAVEEYSKRVLGTLSSKDINRVLLTEAEYTLQVGRERFQKRRAVVVRLKRNGEKDTIDSVFAPPKSKTNASAQSQLATDNSKEPQIAFLFSGFGGTHVHAIRELYAAFPTFRRNFDRCSISIAKLMDIDPRTMLQTEEGMDWKSQLFSALLFNSLQVCVALQLIEWGIKPTMGMIAHSLGEYGAAVVSGVMTVEESLFLCHKRFTLLATLPAAAVLFVSLYPVPKIKEIIASIPNCSMEITVINSEMHCLVCGTPDEITTLRAKIHEDTATSGYFLNDFNSTPSHSSRAGPILETFADSILTRVKMNKPTIRYVSCSSCKWVDSTEATTPQHYCHHLSHPILFPTGMECLLQTWSEQEAPPRLVILEIGTSLASHVTQIIGQRNATCIPAMLHNKNNKLNAAQQLLAAAATLWEQGAELDWESYHVGTRNLYKVSLPTYPWERKQCEPPAEPGSAAETLADQDKSFLQILHSKSGKSDQSSDENDAASGTAELFSGKAQVPKELVAAVMEYWTAHAVVTPADMREDSTFFAGGAASMNAMQMLSSLNNKYHIVIPGRVFFAEPTFEHLLTLIHPLVQQQQPQQQVQQQLLRAQQTTPTDQSNETNNSSHTERVATAPAPSSSTNNNNNL